MQIQIKDKKISATQPETIAKVLTKVLNGEQELDRADEPYTRPMDKHELLNWVKNILPKLIHKSVL